MTITLAEESNGELLWEKAYDGSVVAFGRDPLCDVMFAGPSLSMVSRRHAEFRSAGERWLLIDTGSTFGTFVEGHRVKGQIEVCVGMRVQFGMGGPVIKVVGIGDVDREMLEQPDSQGLRRQGNPIQPQATLEIIGEDGTSHRTFPLTRDVFRIGRDPDLEVRLEASSAIVSRIHAEIRRRNSRFLLRDLNSYNGTFLNGMRISAPAELADGDRIELGFGGSVLLFCDQASAGKRKESVGSK